MTVEDVVLGMKLSSTIPKGCQFYKSLLIIELQNHFRCRVSEIDMTGVRPQTHLTSPEIAIQVVSSG